MTRDDLNKLLAQFSISLTAADGSTVGAKLVDRWAPEPPSKVLLFSTEDLPSRPGTPTDMLLGVPAVVEFEGTPHRVQSSPHVPAGQVYVIDEGAMQDALDRALREWRVS